MGKDKRGQVLVDARTAEAASQVYRFRPLEKMLVLKGVEEPVQAYYPVSYARRRFQSTVGSKAGRRIMGRDREVELCLREWGLGGSEQESHVHEPSARRNQGGRCVAVIGPSGFGKTALLQNLGQIAARDLGATTIHSAGNQGRVSIPFYPWRTVIAKLLALCFSGGSLGDSNPIPHDFLASAGSLFDACKSSAAQEANEGGGRTTEPTEAKGEPPAPSEGGNECEEFAQELLARPLWRDKIHLLVLVFPFLAEPLTSAGWDGEYAEANKVEDNPPLDGMLCSQKSFSQLADLLRAIAQTAMTNIRVGRRGGVPAADNGAASTCLVVLDDVDLFDRHSLVLLFFLLAGGEKQAAGSAVPESHLPRCLTFVVSSTSSTRSGVREHNDHTSSASGSAGTTTLIEGITGNHQVQHRRLGVFPFPSLNFRHERQAFLRSWIFSRCPGVFKHNLQSISVSSAMAVFEHIFDQRFDDTVAAKTMALSAGNLTVARAFLEKCLDPPRGETGGCARWPL